MIKKTPSVKNSLLPALCVRDWSGILCEMMGIGIRERGWYFGTILGSEENEASKDIAESPTRSGTPKRKVTELPRY